MNLYILKYNNYYNRTIKKEDSLTDYLEYQLGNVIQGVSFNPGDGVATQQVVNLSEDQIGDYLLAVNEYNEIDSRWFILDCRRERTGQYTLTLRRDLVVDNYSTIINAPCFIEKATLNPTDPMIFNSEGMTFNQIKTSETQLMDETQSAWIVGYVPSNWPESSTEITGKATVEPDPDITVPQLEQWEYYQYSTGTVFRGNAITNLYTVNFWKNPASWPDDTRSLSLYVSFNNNGDLVQYSETGGRSTSNAQLYCDARIPLSEGNQIIQNYQANITTINSQAISYLNTNSVEDTNNIIDLDGKILYDSSTDTYYRIVVNQSELTSLSVDVTTGNLFNTLSTYLNRNYTYPSGQVREWLYGTPGNESFQARASFYNYTISLEQYYINIKTTIDQDRYHLEDQPYDMFCIPYSDTLEIYNNGSLLFTSNKSIAFGMGVSIVSDSGVGAVYDLQLLPYCPVRTYIQTDGTFDIKSSKFDYIQDSEGNNIGVILWASSSSFTFNISSPITITNVKQQSQTDKWRLVSPNYNGQFEFNATLNDGVDYFNVDCTYKPYNPYIHVNPNFKNLYGQDFNDARGLICGGDFSLPQITDAWATYELSNKNYQQIFDRQIQNMEVNNAVQREQQKWQIASGAIGAGVSGALTGAVVGGPIGALVGGALGAGVSAAAGVRDYQLSEQLRQEAIDYTKDQFGYQLGNIQALPYSLAKTSAFTYNNKIFPILEYYTCTPQEKTALQNKLYYNGMTVMRIGTIQEFLRSEPSYIKGKLIRLEGTDNNFHVVNEIANEINKGVFI